MSEIELKEVMKLYQEFTPTTGVYPGAGTKGTEEIVYLGLGLMSEEIEVSESNYSIKEVGDVFWYISQLCNVFGLNLYQLWLLAKEEYKTNTGGIIDLSGALKKLMRDNKDIKSIVTLYLKGALAEVYWHYVHFNSAYTPAETMVMVLTQNRDKLIDRQNRGVLKGDGDNR